MASAILQRSSAVVLPLEDIKQQCRIDADITEEDALLRAMERASVASAEGRLRGPLLDAQCEDVLDGWPRLPWLYLEQAGARVLQSLTVLRGGQPVDLPLDSLHAVVDGRRLRLQPKGGWPPCDSTPGAIRLRYLAGFGPAADSVPESIRQWLRFQVSSYYTFREAFIDDASSVEALPGRFVDALLDPYCPREVTL